MNEITPHPIDLNQTLNSTQDPRCGASVLFVGTTRAETGERQTETLEYECYEAMARQVLAELETEARRRWPIEHCCIVHRIGLVPVGEASIAIAVSSPHRTDAFAAGQWLIDTIKLRAPIWKKEISPDGHAQWQHPSPKSEHRPQRASP